MIIVIQSSGYAGEPRGYAELQRAFGALHVAPIRLLGGGRFSDGTGYVVLTHETDAPVALAALSRAGIQASELRPTPRPKRAA